MEGYIKRFYIGHFLILIIVCISIFVRLSLPAIIISILLFELLIYFLDVKYIQKRKIDLANKLIEIFKAEPFSKGVVKFKIDTFDLFAEIEVDFKLGASQIANVETIRFHIPRNQIDRLSTKPVFVLKEDEIDGIQTYNVHQTDGEGLKFANKRIEKMI